MSNVIDGKDLFNRNPKILPDRSLENFFWYYISEARRLAEMGIFYPFQHEKEFIMVLLKELRNREMITLSDHKKYCMRWIGGMYGTC